MMDTEEGGTLMLRRRVLGLDVGDRRIGVAISDPLGLTAQWLTVITRQTPDRDAEAITTISDAHGVEAVVVGLPLTMRGTVEEQGQKVMTFVELLRSRLSCRVEVLDERLTTRQGERALLELDTARQKRKQLLDQIAAQLILQAYLDGQRQR